MTLEVEMLRDNRLIIVHFIGPLDLGEYQQFVEKIHAELFNHASLPIHTILDLTRVKGLPRNVLSSALSVSKLKHPRDGLIFFVTVNSVTRRFVELFVRLTKDPDHRLSAGVEEAIAQVNVALAKEQSAVQS